MYAVFCMIICYTHVIYHVGVEHLFIILGSGEVISSEICSNGKKADAKSKKYDVFGAVQ